MSTKSDQIKETQLTWDDFNGLMQDQGKKPGIYYRGQPKKDYQLETTLARYLPLPAYDTHIYHRKMLQMAESDPKLRALLARVPQDFLFKRDFWYPGTTPEYEDEAYATFCMMMYFRHHGIPSPLLDWSQDPYVAAFFALSEVNDHDAAIFVLKKIDTDSTYKVETSGRTKLILIEHTELINGRFNAFPESDLLLKRHKIQQSAYTICYDNKGVVNHDIVYSMMNHDDNIVASSRKEIKNSYSLEKYIIPADQKTFALNDLFENRKLNNKILYCDDFSYADLALEHLYLK